MINELRIYDVPPNNAQPFLDRFRDHAAPMLTEYGMRILSMWTSEDSDTFRFVYLLAWDDEAQAKEAWAAFATDETWKQIKAETSAKYGTLVNSLEGMTLTPTAFSAALGGES